MTAQPFGVQLAAAGGVAYDIPNVTGFSFRAGRNNITDNWSGSTAVVYGRSPSSLTYTPAIGQSVSMYLTNTAGTLATGIVSDWRVIYGTIPALDTWELTLESAWGVAGRKTGTVITYANASTVDMANAIVSAAGAIGLGVGTTGSSYPWGFGSTTSAQTITGQLASALTTLMQTEQGYILDDWAYGSGGPQSRTRIYGRNSYDAGTTALTFSDATSIGANVYRYTEIEFLSAAYNYGAVVNVDATGFSQQTAGTGTYTQNFSTISGSASEAANLAGYLQAELNLATSVPYRLTTTWGATQSQNSNAAAILGITTNVYKNMAITFRGTTYQCLIEGLDFQANPSGWTVNYYLSSSLQNAFLRLDNSVYGTLDNNKLGF